MAYAQDPSRDDSDSKLSSGDFKSRGKREKTFMSKVVIRRLPPTMTEDQFLEQISPVSANDYFYFVKGDLSLGPNAFARAYLNFLHSEDIFIFKEKFDGYVFVDGKGNEYPAIVEFAPFQKVPKKRNKKRDPKCGTIKSDPDYLNFLENLKKPENVSLPTAEVYLEEIETRDREIKANNGVLKKTTPLIEFLKQRKLEQQKIREERREERKRKELEKKRMREDERRRRKAEKERKERKESLDDIEEGSGDTSKREPVVQVLKNPDRVKGKDVRPKEYHGHYEKDRSSKAGEAELEKSRIRDKPRNERSFHERDRTRRERVDHRYNKYNQLEFRNRGDSSNVQSFRKNSPRNEGKGSFPTSAAKGMKDRTEVVEIEKEDETSKGSKTINQQSAECSSKSECYSNDGKDSSKDPRTERRIRNKDRPSMEIYRPGMRRFGAQRNSPQKEISTSSNSTSPSPSPTPPLTTKLPSEDKTSLFPTENVDEKERDPNEELSSFPIDV